MEYRKGGSFLISESSDSYIPEEFSEEHIMIQDMVRDFVNNEIKTKMDKIEQMDYNTVERLIQDAGELGLLGVDVSEKYGGAGMSKIAASIVAEELGRAGSFSVSIGAHSGIGTLPIVYYGTEKQKEKYLPKLLTGEWAGAYALTEPTSGSDALAAKTKAVLSSDKKHYILSGTKQFITNAGFAFLFIVFAKVDDQLSAFIVERSFPGVSFGEEEKKLGIKGSSTRAVALDKVNVPIENLLGKVGDGVKIALNILNIGRLKLGVGCIGSCKDVITDVLTYTSEREQFGRPINTFGLIRQKIADMGIKTFAVESAAYRTVGLIQDLVSSIDSQADDAERKILKSIEEYSIECAIMKVFGSEAFDFIVDEGLQCLGGYGYISEYPMERAYRDSRINRIFEGTNEINRLVITGMLIKKGLKGQIDLMGAIKKVQKEITEFPVLSEETGELLEYEKRVLVNIKKGVLLIAGAAAQKFDKKIEGQQEILAMIADCIIELYVLESMVLRVVKINKNKGKVDIPAAMTQAYCFDVVNKIEGKLKMAAAATFEGDDLRVLLGAIKRFMKYTPVNVKEIRRNIARHMIKYEKYQI